MSNNTKSYLILASLYALLLAAMCPWQYQVVSYRLFIFVTVIMALNSAVLAINKKEQVSTILERIRKGEPGYKPEKLRSYKSYVSLIYLPAVVILVMAGSWFLAAAWTFIFLVMCEIFGTAAKELEKYTIK